MSEHTPTPWEVDADFDYDLCFTEGGEPMSGWQIYGPKSWPVAAAWVEGIVDRPTGRANAEFIVKAANAHDRLVEALEAVIGLGVLSSTQPEYRMARTALALARGEVE